MIPPVTGESCPPVTGESCPLERGKQLRERRSHQEVLFARFKLGSMGAGSIHAVITAGGRVDGDFAAAIGSPIKALAPLGGATLLDRSIDAARGAGVARIAVVGGSEVRAHCDARVEKVIDAAENGGENILRALDAWPGEPLLFLTSDIPFVEAGALRGFLERSAAYAITMPLAAAHAYATRFPGAPEHTVALGGERVANGNTFYLAPAAIDPVRSWATRFFAARKSLIGMAVLLGPALLLRFATRSLTLGAIERKASRTLGVSAAAIRDADPGLCYDVDTLDDYRYALGAGR